MNYRTILHILKVWGDIDLFSGRMDLVDVDESGFPIYIGAAGDIKVYFNNELNRWVASDSLDENEEIRAIGNNESCPDQTNWLVWNGKQVRWTNSKSFLDYSIFTYN